MADENPPLYRRTLSGFVPENEEALAFFNLVEFGGLIKLDGKVPRHLKRLQAYWMMVKLVADNTEWADGDKQIVHDAIKAALGLGEWKQIPGATREMFKPQSISFAKMTEPEFVEFFNRATTVCEKYWLKVPPGTLAIESQQRRMVA
jgi:hypothetical protein